MLAGGHQPVYASGECEIDLARLELRILGSAVPIGGRAFEILEVLAQSAGELVTKDELMNRVWPGAVVVENTLQVHAAAVRKALGSHRALLKTESGRGYRLLGSWTVQHHGPATPLVAFQQLRRSRHFLATNFPVIDTELIGRSPAVQRLRDLVSAYRVVTLTGPGGIGKTTLALEVAHAATRSRKSPEYGAGTSAPKRYVVSPPSPIRACLQTLYLVESTRSETALVGSGRGI
jgi:DNA-binding winged helix-turn-helix (wHTH) protein